MAVSFVVLLKAKRRRAGALERMRCSLLVDERPASSREALQGLLTAQILLTSPSDVLDKTSISAIQNSTLPIIVIPWCSIVN